jgi:hypothetical protein
VSSDSRCRLGDGPKIYNIIEHRRDLSEAMVARDTPGRRCRQRAQAGAVIAAIVSGFSSRAASRLPDDSVVPAKTIRE